MSTIKEKLQLALDSKANIKAAIEEKGGSVTDFASYADAIRNIKDSEEEIEDDIKYGKQTLVVDFDDYTGSYININFASLFGSSTYYVTKLVLPKNSSIIQFPNDLAGYVSLRDLTIYQDLYSFAKDAILGVGTNVTDGNLRLEDWVSGVPEELLDRFVGWELYINGEHIGTITPKAEGGYYYTESIKHDYYAGDGYNGTFIFDAGSANDYLMFYDGIPQELLDASYYGGKTIISNRGEEWISRSNGASLYINKKEGVVEWLDIK